MSDTNEQKNNVAPQFDRVEYLRQVRQTILSNLNLPPDTKPSQVAKLIKIKHLMDEKKKDNQI